MKAYDLVELASRNLRESLLRNGLTTAGIAVGVASLLAMISLGVGLQELAGSRLSKSGLFDTIAVSAFRTSAGLRDEQPGVREMETPRVLDEDARREIEKLPNVVEVQPEMRFLAELRYHDSAHVTSIGGLAPSAGENEAFDNMQGRFFSSPVAYEAVVKKEFAQQLVQEPNSVSSGNGALQADEKLLASVIGQDLVLRYAQRQPLPRDENTVVEGNGDDVEDYGFSVTRKEVTLRIVGLTDLEPFGGMRSSGRARVFIPTQLAEDLNIMQTSDVRSAIRSPNSKKAYNTLMARVSAPSQVEAVEAAIEKMGFRAFSILDASQGLRRFFTVLDLFLGIFGSLALAVASLGIINTLVMAVLERRREIGILKAVGASEGDVQRLFFAEAGAMGLIGGIVGVLLGGAIGKAINVGTRVYLERHQLPPETVWSAPVWLVAAAIAFAVLVSLAAGLYPARRAAKLDPVQALRYE